MAVWLLAAISTKRSVYRESRAQRLRYSILLIAGYFLLIRGHRLPYSLSARVLPHIEVIAWAGAALCVAGLAFCIWARVIAPKAQIKKEESRKSEGKRKNQRKGRIKKEEGRERIAECPARSSFAPACSYAAASGRQRCGRGGMRKEGGGQRTEIRSQGVKPMRGFGGDGGKAGGSIMSITRCKIVTITAS